MLHNLLAATISACVAYVMRFPCVEGGSVQRFGTVRGTKNLDVCCLHIQFTRRSSPKKGLDGKLFSLNPPLLDACGPD